MASYTVTLEQRELWAIEKALEVLTKHPAGAEYTAEIGPLMWRLASAEADAPPAARQPAWAPSQPTEDEIFVNVGTCSFDGRNWRALDQPPMRRSQAYRFIDEMKAKAQARGIAVYYDLRVATAFVTHPR